MIEKEDFVRRLWDKDPTLWKKEPEHQTIIRNSLGWLEAPQTMQAQVPALTAFAGDIKKEGFTQVFLLGMGGSSLAPEVFSLSLGAMPGYPKLFVLDSTDPVRIQTAEKLMEASKPLFIVSSKSGGTIESSCLFKYFYEKMEKRSGAQAGERFIAITDPGTSLEAIAKEHKFRKVFLNPVDIGGRFSALSYFGLVPAALLGLDLNDLLDRALRMVQACRVSTAEDGFRSAELQSLPHLPFDFAQGVGLGRNPGLELGLTLAGLAVQGKDKVTFLTSGSLAPFGAWVEQLIAESTGKEGKGLIPIAGEPIGGPTAYGQDRVFVVMTDTRSENSEHTALAVRLEVSGHPVIRIFLREPGDIAPEFFRWEVATAAAGSCLGIDAFDQPNVQDSKDRTKELLEAFKRSGKLPEIPAAPLGSIVAYLNQVRPGDYVAILAYMNPSSENEAILQGLRQKIRDRFTVATTLGWGPRFLHSTGQLHKGGPNTGVFLQITVDDELDLEIPWEPFSFGTLKRAQALGDLMALQSKGRRALRVHLKAPVTKSLKIFSEALESALQTAVPR
jgi:transaldolase/glucose-6-phosphate isomerase